MNFPSLVILAVWAATSVFAQESVARYRLLTWPVMETRAGALWKTVEKHEAVFKVDTALGSVWRLESNVWERVEIRDLVTQAGIEKERMAQALARLETVIIPDLVCGDVNVTNALELLNEHLRKQGESRLRIAYHRPPYAATVRGISAHEISVRDALKLIADITGLTPKRVEGDTVVFSLRIDREGEVVPQGHKLSPAFRLQAAGSSASNVLSRIGYPPLDGGSFKYVPEQDLLHVSDTRYGHHWLDTLLHEAGLARQENGRFCLHAELAEGKPQLFLVDGETGSVWQYQALVSREGRRTEWFTLLTER